MISRNKQPFTTKNYNRLKQKSMEVYFINETHRLNTNAIITNIVVQFLCVLVSMSFFVYNNFVYVQEVLNSVVCRLYAPTL